MKKALIVCLNTWGFSFEELESMSEEQLLTLLREKNKEEYNEDFEPDRNFLIATIELMVWKTTQWLKNGASIRYESDVDIAIRDLGFDLKKDNLEDIVDKLYDDYKKEVQING